MDYKPGCYQKAPELTALVAFWTEHLIHQILKRSRCICKPKAHDKQLIIEKFVAQNNSSNNSFPVGIGKLSLIVIAFRALQSGQNWQLTSFFLTNNTREEKGLELGCIIPWLTMSYAMVSICIFRLWEYQ